ncbi:MAG: aspartate dehydrogenase [Thermoplasmata archaeon]
MKIGVIGCGAIGAILSRSLDRMEEIDEIFLFDRSFENTQKMAKKLKKGNAVKNIRELIDKSDMVVESASQEAVREFAPMALRKKKNVFIMSVGALHDTKLLRELELIGKKNKCRLYIPSGAICGIDGIISASAGKIKSVTLTTTKPIVALRDNAYIKKRKINLDAIKKPTTIFEGCAEDAVKHFPKNINVAATLSLAGIGFKKTKVRIVADPKATMNKHKIVVSADFGELETEARSIPCPENPKTSYLAALSAIATIKKIIKTLSVGT